MADWMKNLSKSKTSKPLLNLSIPGSHDSFTYGLDVNGPIGNDEPDLKPFQYFPFVKEIVLRWSKTQKISVTEQLNLGIRYFDVRVSRFNNSTDDQIKIVHGLYGDKISDILLEILEFSTNHPNEAILLDFNHFYNFDNATHSYLIDLIITMMDSKLVPVKTRCSDVTLDKMWKADESFLIYYHNSSVLHPFWSPYAIQSPWANTDSLEQLCPYLEGKLRERLNPQSKYSQIFFVTQGILTIKLKDIIATGGLGSLERNVANKTTARVVSWIDQVQSELGKAFNIFIVDFVNMHDYINTIILLNTI